ncbi:MAG TPA: hypothetical protein VFO55_00200 [Gemmatimonadaceae bacterium]|nr:hypothetical protein [Gemmatimonadaceae bacterium]
MGWVGPRFDNERAVTQWLVVLARYWQDDELARTIGPRPMSQSERLERLIREFERVGVDPNTISAGLAVREDDAMRALAALPDRAGPSAFLRQLRTIVSPTEQTQ